MSWQSQLLQQFKDLKLELEAATQFKDFLSKGSVKVAIVVPHLPEKKIIEQIKALIPKDMEVEIVQRMKTSTANRIIAITQKLGYTMTTTEAIDRDLKLLLNPPLDQTETNNLVSDISSLIYEDGFYDTWSIEESKRLFKFNRNIIKILSTRKMNTVEIDPLDVRIALESTRSVEEFLILIGG